MRLFLSGMCVWLSLAFGRVRSALNAPMSIEDIYLIICVIYFAHNRVVCVDLVEDVCLVIFSV